jgi:hypothetical protein
MPAFFRQDQTAHELAVDQLRTAAGGTASATDVPMATSGAHRARAPRCDEFVYLRRAAGNRTSDLQRAEQYRWFSASASYSRQHLAQRLAP